MGALIDYAICSVPYCGKLTTPNPCTHGMKGGKGGLTRDNYIIYDLVAGVNFFETSALDEEPADPDAFAPDDVMAPHMAQFSRDDIWRTGLEAA